MEPRVEAIFTGPAEFDYIYIAEQELEDRYVSIWCNSEMVIYQVTKQSVFDDEYQDIENALEQYEKLEDAIVSKSFLTFLNLDRLIDEKIRVTLERVDDTKYYGIRIADGICGGERTTCIEAFNTNQPEHKEYLQVLRKGNKFSYSASHTSYFMRLHLGEIYKYHFRNDQPEEYFIQIEDLKDLDEKYWYFAKPFVQLRNRLIKRAWESGEKQVIQEEDEYKPLVTVARGGRDEKGILYVELTLDNSRKNRYYIIISEGITPAYQVRRKSVYDEMIQKKEMYHWYGEKVIDYDSLDDASSGEYGRYFIALNKFSKKAQVCAGDLIWRFGYKDSYGFNNCQD